MPLYVGLVPPENVVGVLRVLLEDIEKRRYRVSTGVIGFNVLARVLPQRDAVAVMYQLANQTTYPSLGHQVRLGATTFCETFECDPMQGQNMRWLGGIDQFFYRHLAGIQFQSAGYRRVVIQPEPQDDLQHVSASRETVRGRISVDWAREKTSLRLKVTIPAGVEGEIRIPRLGLDKLTISEGGTPVWRGEVFVSGVSGLSSARSQQDSIDFQAGSGSYDFELKGSLSSSPSTLH